jgi:hypothetical protein
MADENSQARLLTSTYRNRDSPSISVKFNVRGSVHRNDILIYIQQDATLHPSIYGATAPSGPWRTS